MAKPALAIMARIPSCKGKSRLKRVLTSEQREALQWAFLFDGLNRAAEVPELTIFLATTPADHSGRVKKAAGHSIRVIPQPEGDLGGRMLEIAETILKQGFAPVLVVGTDTPLWPPSYLELALDILQNKDIVLGPTTDGGYYLIGMSSYVPAVFKNISWSTCEVLQQTIRRCKEAQLTYDLLPSTGDIDVPRDLQGLVEVLKRHRPENGWVPDQTAAFLDGISFDLFFNKKG